MRVESQHRDLQHQPASLVESNCTSLGLSASTRHIYKWTAGMRIKARQDIMLNFSAKTSDAENELWHTQYTLRTDNVLKVASATDIVHPAQLTASQTWRQGSNTWPALEPDATFLPPTPGIPFVTAGLSWMSLAEMSGVVGAVSNTSRESRKERNRLR